MLAINRASNDYSNINNKADRKVEQMQVPPLKSNVECKGKLPEGTKYLTNESRRPKN